MGRKAVILIVSLWVIPISIIVNRVVPDPYMDEIFHVPQAQQYCRGNFRSWDPMITTPPGLYYLSLAYVAFLFPSTLFTKFASSLLDLCSTPILRSVNGALAVICSALTYDILIHLNPGSKRRATFYAIIIALYPLHWFFTFLYYTDVASVAAVLAMYLASLKQKYWISAIFGALAVFVRQTNIIWMLFIAASAAIDYAERLYKGKYIQSDDDGDTSVTDSDGAVYERSIPTNPSLRRRKLESANLMTKTYVWGAYRMPCSGTTAGLVDELQASFLMLWCMKWKILVAFAPFAMILVSFASFVIWNGSIVLGAKESHVVSPHLAQLMYFGLVSAAAVAPVHFSKAQVISIYRLSANNKVRSLLLWLIALITGFIIVHFFSISHPYLLADNRHYTFYIWRKIFGAHWTVKYLLVPLYTYSWFSIIKAIGKSQKKVWTLLFTLACAAVLIPAPLIEFRYYSIPFFFLVLHSQIDDHISWVLIAALYVAVDIFTMLMFLCRPFHWAHEPGTQRFIW